MGNYYSRLRSSKISARTEAARVLYLMTDMGRMEWKQLKVALVFVNSVTMSLIEY